MSRFWILDFVRKRNSYIFLKYFLYDILTIMKFMIRTICHLFNSSRMEVPLLFLFMKVLGFLAVMFILVIKYNHIF